MSPIQVLIKSRCCPTLDLSNSVHFSTKLSTKQIIVWAKTCFAYHQSACDPGGVLHCKQRENCNRRNMKYLNHIFMRSTKTIAGTVSDGGI